MEHPLKISCQCVYTLIVLGSITFGFVNLYQFKNFIMPQLTLSLFYLFSISCLTVTVISCWLDIQ